MLSSIYPQQKAGTEPKSVMTKKSSKAVSRKSASSSTSREASPAEGTDAAAVRRLQQFDLKTDYGPCTGMTRTQRWKRAHKFGLDPPSDVQKLLLDHPELDECIWHGRI